MTISNLQKNKHLLLRAGFGANLSQIKNLDQVSLTEIWKKLATNDPLIPIQLKEAGPDFDYQQLSKMDAEMKKEIQKKNRRSNLEINLKFLNQMVHSEDQLREKMAFFWHGHFATRVVNSRFNLQLLNTIREKSLGNFGDLLKAVSQSPAMLQFLNNQQNKKGHPNENFAREVMELFTLGRGNYTEKDVQEGARAFTGWSFLPDGSFFERPRQHDFGPKTFLGKTGNFDGNDALNIILEQKGTAKFIVTKIYKFFVNEKINPGIIEHLSDQFYDSKYDIKKLMTEIFTSKWFYNEENIGAKIKSPIELMAGIMRTLPMQLEKPENLIVYQKLLGQMLLYPPNVAGWPSGNSWIDSSTLMLRLQIPQIWSGLRPLELEAKSDDDVEMGLKNNQMRNKGFKNPNIIIDWNLVESTFKNKSISDYLLQTKSSNEKIIEQFSDSSLKLKIINVMSTPEFQLC
ncbi:Uncharacterized conserved protein, DUF1800 family [Kaistella chaponensis]|uniref:Uncharacterized conserved protein, DUF1800 family n=1 Tax=Kaistella chaponensis TaxID=713588 RepID=A0A1N7JB81_9FLAO|nr:DUF1800 domain-containing protein [Kaistella chaponensis]SIS46540.1 Uncharacterized conserved protein, DUF1800 family [Kaistella chaponensis]